MEELNEALVDILLEELDERLLVKRDEQEDDT